jgi:site-specific recombinase XerD
MADLPVPASSPSQPAPAITDELRSARDYAAAEKADATRTAYRSDLQDFVRFCDVRGLSPALPASGAVLAAYVAALADAGRKYATIRRRVAAIAYAHRLKGLTPPDQAEAVKAVLRGIRRSIGTAVNRKAPATAKVVAAMLKKLPDTLTGKRDRALLLIGFAAALRRSELVDLKVNDLEFTAAGVIIHLRKSKTDQEGKGQFVAVPNGQRLAPVAALREWLAAAAIADGFVFRSIGKGGRRVGARLSGRAVADIVKRCARDAGFDVAIFSGHSMRAGFVTTALERGADPLDVMRVTRHVEISTLADYDRRAKAFKNHAGKKFL